VKKDIFWRILKIDGLALPQRAGAQGRRPRGLTKAEIFFSSRVEIRPTRSTCV